MKRECKSIPEAVRMIEGDKNRKSSIIVYKKKAYHFRSNAQVRGAITMIKLLTDSSKELTKLLIGRKEAEEIHKAKEMEK